MWRKTKHIRTTKIWQVFDGNVAKMRKKCRKIAKENAAEMRRTDAAGRIIGDFSANKN